MFQQESVKPQSIHTMVINFCIDAITQRGPRAIELSVLWEPWAEQGQPCPGAASAGHSPALWVPTCPVGCSMVTQMASGTQEHCHYPKQQLFHQEGKDQVSSCMWQLNIQLWQHPSALALLPCLTATGKHTALKIQHFWLSYVYMQKKGSKAQCKEYSCISPERWAEAKQVTGKRCQKWDFSRQLFPCNCCSLRNKSHPCSSCLWNTQHIAADTPSVHQWPETAQWPRAVPVSAEAACERQH